MSGFSHVSVMPQEVVQAFDLARGGIYVDGTLGGGGHSRLMFENMPSGGRVIGIDRDTAALAAASRHLEGLNFQAVQGNFHNMPEILHGLGVSNVDGILLDLGVSSHQLDTPERGFSYRFDGPLDMRMDPTAQFSAYDIVNSYAEKELADLIYTYGEERYSRRVAHAICNARKTAPIITTTALVHIIEGAMPRPRFGDPHPAMRTFMAIRIAVNDELSPLSGALAAMINCLNPGGRIAVITFHSLEDRIVKTTFAKIASPCDCPRDLPYCVCGKKPGVKVITRKPILPTQGELESNRRAHSAKLRIAEKI